MIRECKPEYIIRDVFSHRPLYLERPLWPYPFTLSLKGLVVRRVTDLILHFAFGLVNACFNFIAS